MVVKSTDVAVIARQVVGQVGAALVCFTGIDCADVAVVAVLRRSADTASGLAVVIDGARIVVGAEAGGGCVRAASGGDVAEVQRTGIAVIAVKDRRAHAFALGAGILHGAGVLVVAVAVPGNVGAARGGRAVVEGADVVVVAGEFSRRDALSVGAFVDGCARIVVVAGERVERIDAADSRVAVVGGAGVGVVAVQHIRAHALALNAGVGLSALTAVVAVPGHGRERALAFDAGILGAGIGIVAE